MAGGERGPAAVRLEVRRRNARRLCAASLRAVALRSLPSRRTVLSPAAVSAGAAGLRLALRAAGPRAWTAAAGVGRAHRPKPRSPAGRTRIRHAEAAGNVWTKSPLSGSLGVYRALSAAEGRPLDTASRYSPIPRYQAAFRNTPAFAELEELAGLLRDKLQGRPSS